MQERLTEFTNLFSPNNFKKNDDIIINYFMTNVKKMADCNSHKTHNIYPNVGVSLSDLKQFRINKINENKDYFVAEIKERELMSKILSKYIASFDYFNKSLFFSVTTVSIASFQQFLLHPLQPSLKHLQEWQVQVLVLHVRFLQES